MEKRQKNKTEDRLGRMINKGFQTTQDLFVGEIKVLKEEMNNNFKKVNQQINNINRNVVDVVRLEDFNKLDGRVVDIEELINLKVKKS